MRKNEAPWGMSTEAVMACAGATTLEGIDVSGYRGSINWHQVAGGGKAFAIMKATEGTGFVDSTFAANWSGTAAAGVIRSAYHFFHPGQILGPRPTISLT